VSGCTGTQYFLRSQQQHGRHRELSLTLGVGNFNGVSTYEVFSSHKTRMAELIVVGFKKDRHFHSSSIPGDHRGVSH
jgi:hypothetical protein